MKHVQANGPSFFQTHHLNYKNADVTNRAAMQLRYQQGLLKFPKEGTLDTQFLLPKNRHEQLYNAILKSIEKKGVIPYAGVIMNHDPQLQKEMGQMNRNKRPLHEKLDVLRKYYPHILPKEDGAYNSSHPHFQRWAGHSHVLHEIFPVAFGEIQPGQIPSHEDLLGLAQHGIVVNVGQIQTHEGSHKVNGLVKTIGKSALGFLAPMPNKKKRLSESFVKRFDGKSVTARGAQIRPVTARGAQIRPVTARGAQINDGGYASSNNNSNYHNGEAGFNSTVAAALRR